MSRTPLLVLALGVILIAAALLMDPRVSGSRSTVRAAGDETHATPDVGGAPARGLAAPRPERAPLAAPPEPSRTVEVEVTALVAGTRAPSAGALVELWRSATGTLGEPSFRPAKRLGPRARPAGDDGRIRFEAERGTSLAVTGRSADGGPTAWVELGLVGATGPDLLRVELELEPPPAPLDVTAVDPAGTPLPGVSIWLVPRGAMRWAEFPGGSEIAQRTDGDGRCTLDGSFRSQGWLAIDGAGRAPRVVAVESLADERELRLELEPDVVAEVAVEDASGAPVSGALVEMRFELEGHATVRSARTSRRGVATVRRLPSGCEIYPHVEQEQGTAPHRFGAVRFNRQQAEGRPQAGPRIELRLP